MRSRPQSAAHPLHPSGRAWRASLCPWALVGLALACSGAAAQTAGRSTGLSASVDTQVSYNVDNRKGGLSGGDFVTEIRPGLQISSRSGRVVGSLSYSLGLSHHTRDFDGERVQNQLNGSFSAEAVDKWLYVDGSATVSQQAVSAFGTQSVAGSTQDNANRVEVGTVTVSPYVRGVLGSAANYELRLSGSATNGRRSISADSSNTSAALSLSSVVSGTTLGWGLSATTQTTDYRAGSESTNDRVIASLSYIPDADVVLTARGGQESTNVASVQRTRYDNWGAGITWRPSPRTRALLSFDERYFGNSYRVLLEHRMASTSVDFSSSRDTSNSTEPTVSGQRFSLYDVFFSQFASLEPDAALRDVLVRDFLRAQGLDPNALVSGGFINTGITALERHQLTAAYAGRRLTGSVQAFSTRSEALGATSAIQQEPIEQWGYIGTASYRLSPTESLTLTGSRLLTRPTVTRPGNALNSLSLGYGNQFGRRTSLAMAARYSVFSSALDPYREAAITASLSQLF